MSRYQLRRRDVTTGRAVDLVSAPRDREYKPFRLLELPAELLLFKITAAFATGPPLQNARARLYIHKQKRKSI